MVATVGQFRAAVFDVGDTSCSEWFDSVSPGLNFRDALAASGEDRPLFGMPLWAATRDFSQATRLLKAGLLYSDEVQLSSLPITAILTRRVSPDAMEDLPTSLRILRQDLCECLEVGRSAAHNVSEFLPATVRAIAAIDDLQCGLASSAVVVSRPMSAPTRWHPESGVLDWLAAGMGLADAPGLVPLLSEREANRWIDSSGVVHGRFPIPDHIFEAPGSTRRLLEGLIASHLFGELPAFPDAPMEVVLELREAFADARPQFGAAIVSLARRLDDGLRSGENVGDLLIEIGRTDVRPALAELRAETTDLGAVDALLRAADGKTLAAMATIVVAAAAMGGLAGLSHGLAGLAVSAPVIATAAKEARYQRKHRRELRGTAFWILREVDRRTRAL